MASPTLSSSSYLVLCITYCTLIFLSFKIAPTTASCATQSFSNNRLYATCVDLPTLSSSLHWTYFSDNSTLTLAFVAPPEDYGGWVAWGINPYQPAMIGTRALLAYRTSDGGMSAMTYNISSLDVVPSGIDYGVSGLEAEQNADDFVIFATLQLPDGTTTTNHVWQVGPGMNGDAPMQHAMQPGNLDAVGTLDLRLGNAPALLAMDMTVASLLALLVLHRVLLH